MFPCYDRNAVGGIALKAIARDLEQSDEHDLLSYLLGDGPALFT